jgi:uncharacterized protein (TIGR00369 family)
MDEQRWRELESHYLASPFHEHLGLTLRVETAGQAVVSLTPQPWAANHHGTVAGGIVATMIDSAVCQAVRTVIEPRLRVWTLDLKINYVRPAKVASGFFVRAVVDHAGRTIAVGSGRAMTPDDTLLAVGLVTVAVRPAPDEA